MSDRDTWQMLLNDFKKACEDSDTIYALTDAWTAYITKQKAGVERLTAENQSMSKDGRDWALMNRQANRIAELEAERLREILDIRNKDSFVTERHHAALARLHRIEEAAREHVSGAEHGGTGHHTALRVALEEEA